MTSTPSPFRWQVFARLCLVGIAVSVMTDKVWVVVVFQLTWGVFEFVVDMIFLAIKVHRDKKT